MLLKSQTAFAGPVVLASPRKSSGASTHSANDTTRQRGKRERSRADSWQDRRLLRANGCCDKAIAEPPMPSNSICSKESFASSVLIDCVGAKDLEIALLARDNPYRTDCAQPRSIAPTAAPHEAPSGKETARHPWGRKQGGRRMPGPFLAGPWRVHPAPATTNPTSN